MIDRLEGGSGDGSTELRCREYDHFFSLHCTALHCTQLKYVVLHCTSLTSVISVTDCTAYSFCTYAWSVHAKHIENGTRDVGVTGCESVMKIGYRRIED